MTMPASGFTRVVVGYSERGEEVFRTTHDTPSPAHIDAMDLVDYSHAAYAVVLDEGGRIVSHTGTAPCDRLLTMREGAKFVVRGRRYTIRAAGGEGWGYYPGDARPGHGPRSEGFRVAVWLPSSRAGQVMVNALTKIKFPEE